MRNWTHEFGNLWQPTISGLQAFGAQPATSQESATEAQRESELRRALWADCIDDCAGAECLLRLGANRWRSDATLHAHSERVANLALGLGQRIKLADRELQSLQTAALLHDCGKLALDPHVLGKPGALDAGEWNHVQQHPACGTRLLERFAFLRHALPGVRSHHERWDGSGYGEGLRGEEIPLVARIIALCDVFDALTHARSYNGAQTKKKALRILCEGSATHFDPILCDHFVALQSRAVH